MGDLDISKGDSGKRVADLAISFSLLLLLTPLFLIIAALIKIDSRGPVLFRQRRLGLGGQEFMVLKFRTMQDGCSSRLHREFLDQMASDGVEQAELMKLTDDPRVTRVGKLLRRLSLDELPQLFNVVGGSMSLIGPRPALGYELQYYEPRHFGRFAVRPGITGLWQVSGRSSLSLQEMLDLDVEYATSRTVSADIAILVRTPVAAIRNAA